MRTDYENLTPTDVLDTLKTISATEYQLWYAPLASHPHIIRLIFVDKTLTVKEMLVALLDNPNLANPTDLNPFYSSALQAQRQKWARALAELSNAPQGF